MDIIPKPEWIRTKFKSNTSFSQVGKTINNHGLNTICTSGKCPNIWECWNKGTATLMILGDICTRQCSFCNTKTGKPEALSPSEPNRVAASIRLLKLKHAVITSVDRDDLEDKGANQWAATIKAIKKYNPSITLEVLIPDFDANKELLKLIVDEKPNIISHNLETVERLTPSIRSRAKYRRSLDVLSFITKTHGCAKTGIMLGLGEKEEEILTLMDDALDAGCTILTIGQYLQPSKKNIRVYEYITPEKFEEYKIIGLEKGFKHVESGPFVRSSYCAEKHV